MDLRNDAVRLFYSPKDVYDKTVEGYLEGNAKRHLEVRGKGKKSQKGKGNKISQKLFTHLFFFFFS